MTVTYVVAMPGDAWRGIAIVSLPIIPDHDDPKLTVSFVDDGWYAYDTAHNKYAGYDDTFSWFEPREATPGRAFWAYFDGDAGAPHGTIPPQDQPARVHLKPGWNLVGTPFITQVVWDEDAMMVQETGKAQKSLGQSGDVVANFAWGWIQDADDPLTGSYRMICDASLIPTADHALEPWRGYWIRAYRECDLILTAQGD